MVSTTNRWSSKEVLNIGAMYSHWRATLTNLVDVPFYLISRVQHELRVFVCMPGKLEPQRLSRGHEFM